MDQLSKKEQVNTFNIERSPAKVAYVLLDARTPLELSDKYNEEDQKLMHSGEWDYRNPSLVINQVQKILEDINPKELIEEEREWVQEILWFWYHHAISCAVWRYKDKEEAKIYAKKALELQPENHPNKITRLLNLLLEDKMEEANKWAKTIAEEPEKTSALELIKEWPL